ncbi:MAG: hypothetical protein A2138_12625 [Deltaproteobacteria bacterium RBG_16_71_12]|nr:MAG: hypothetical protein A2138_12625 [Deltaproteobacteria bacterium RBG_16_71_12]
MRQPRKWFSGAAMPGCEGRPAGFALAAYDGERWHIEELFIVAGARKHGIGRAAAAALCARHPGPWTLTGG